VDVSQVGRYLLVAALVLAATGLLLLLAGGLGLGRLPGDLAFGKKNVRFYVPIATSIVLSVVATIVLNLLSRRR
jgi:Zn-dependent protease with chaperone function